MAHGSMLTDEKCNPAVSETTLVLYTEDLAFNTKIGKYAEPVLKFPIKGPISNLWLYTLSNLETDWKLYDRLKEDGVYQ